MKIEIGIAKSSKYGVSSSGDTVEVVERPQGGFSIILADGQGSGAKAKIISNLVANKTASLIGDGARDGAVGRAAHDYLYTLRRGKVSSTLNILSVDLDTDSIVISRNSNTPVILIDGSREVIFDQEVRSIGFHKEVKPLIQEIDLKVGLNLLAFSDGILHAGRRFEQQVDLKEIIAICKRDVDLFSQNLARRILAYTLQLDKERPQDDMTVVVLSIKENQEAQKIKEYSLSLPI